MSMSKKDFIALADHLRPLKEQITFDVRLALINFMQTQNPRFMADRWTAYLNGECGPNGGKRTAKKLVCPDCKSDNITPAHGHKLNKCLSCQLAFD